MSAVVKKGGSQSVLTSVLENANEVAAQQNKPKPKSK